MYVHTYMLEGNKIALKVPDALVLESRASTSPWCSWHLNHRMKWISTACRDPPFPVHSA